MFIELFTPDNSTVISLTNLPAVLSIPTWLYCKKELDKLSLRLRSSSPAHSNTPARSPVLFHSFLSPFSTAQAPRTWSLAYFPQPKRDLRKAMRIHTTFLVFHNGHIATSSNKPQSPFPTAIMPTHRRQQNQNDPSSGEDFSDVSPVDTDDDESVAQTLDNWTFPVVSSRAKREEYETASKFHWKFLLTTSEVVFRLLKARKSRSANFKIKSKSFHSKILNFVQILKGKRTLAIPAVFHQTMTSSSRSTPKSLESWMKCLCPPPPCQQRDHRQIAWILDGTIQIWQNCRD